MFFPNHLPEAILRRSKSQPTLKSVIFREFCHPEDILGPKGLQRSSPPLEGERLGADPVAIFGAEIDPKATFDRSWVVWGGFWKDLGRVWGGFFHDVSYFL